MTKLQWPSFDRWKRMYADLLLTCKTKQMCLFLKFKWLF